MAWPGLGMWPVLGGLAVQWPALGGHGQAEAPLRARPESHTEVLLPADSRPWICKPTASNQGKGIFLLRTHEEVAALQATTQSTENDPDHRKMPLRMTQARVVQRCPTRDPQWSGGRILSYGRLQSPHWAR